VVILKNIGNKVRILSGGLAIKGYEGVIGWIIAKTIFKQMVQG
jgi:prolipoprotein diacylglyceryltransferase